MIYVIHILENIVRTVYQQFGAACLVTVLGLFTVLYGKEHGYHRAVGRLFYSLKRSRKLRRTGALIFYTAMILFRTLLSRKIYPAPWEKIVGIWSLHDADGSIYTENIENVLLFLPFTMLLLWARGVRQVKKENSAVHMVAKCTLLSFLFSLSIEKSQLVFFLGTFQLTDLLFNTLGGLLGALLYCLFCLLYDMLKRKSDI